MFYALAPRRIFDVGVGYGRWGMLAHEICDVWHDRVQPADWRVEVIGVEMFGGLVHDYHRSFYNRIEIGDALEVIEREPGPFDIVVIGDVLEHCEKSDGRRLLELADRKSAYTILNVPLGKGRGQQALYGDPYERHRSQWPDRELKAMYPVCRRIFKDFHGRTHGVYLLASDVIDLAEYWRGRRHTLKHAAFPEILNIYGRSSQTGAAPTLANRIRNRLRRHPVIEAAARKVYHAGKRLSRCTTTGPMDDGQRADLRVRFEIADPVFPALAVVRPDSFGVTTAAGQAFPNLALCPKLSDAQADPAAAAILEHGFSRIAFHDLAPGYEALARKIAASTPEAEMLLVWHGSFAQFDQAPQRNRMKAIVRLCRDGVLKRVGFVKAGMADVARMHGLDAVYLPNRVAPPDNINIGPARSPRKVGVFARDIFRKNAHTQIMAAGLMTDVEIHVNEMPDLAYFPPESPIVEHGSLGHDEFLPVLGAMDVCLHSTLSECYPMMVVEAMIRGVPCITSHTHEIFAESPELYQKLVVSALDNPVAIARKAEEALKARDALSHLCVEYAHHLNRRAECAINEFLGVEAYPAAQNARDRTPPEEVDA